MSKSTIDVRAGQKPVAASDAPPPRRLRVLVVGQAQSGGIGTYIRMLIAEPWLRERTDLELLDTTLPKNIRPGVLSVANIRLALTQAVRVFRRARKADIVHLNMAAAPFFPLVRAVMLTFVARAAGARVILHTHSGFVQHAVARRGYRRLVRVELRAADVFVVNSRANEAALFRLGGQVVRTENGIDARSFRTGPKDEDPPVLSFVGTVCGRKGLIDLRDALRTLWPNGALPVRVVIAGDGKQESPGAMERVQAAYAQAGLRSVEFLGEIGPEGVVDLLARSTVFCLPSHWETFPLAILEAMASGAAVVATDVGDTSFILGHGKAGVVVRPHDVPALADAIRRMTGDPEERARMVETARARVEREFGTERLIRAVYGLYVELAGRGEATEERRDEDGSGRATTSP